MPLCSKPEVFGFTFLARCRDSDVEVCTSVIVLIFSLAASFRESILNAGDGTTEFCNKVFGTWDFSLTEAKSAVIKHRSIRYELLVRFPFFFFLSVS